MRLEVFGRFGMFFQAFAGHLGPHTLLRCACVLSNGGVESSVDPTLTPVRSVQSPELIQMHAPGVAEVIFFIFPG